jgi:endonuclease/exonuclease/phosphatase (EEP) superfamily protein YafD
MNGSPLASPRQRIALVCLLLSAALWIAITLCFLFRWDWAAAVTVFPYWSWTLIGCFAAYVAFRLRGGRWILVTLPVAWIITTLFFADNLGSLWRLLKSDPSSLERREPGAVRVITLNCAGSPAAAAEAGAFKPDIVLLQEIPSTNELARLTQEWFGGTGSFVAGFDCAILARGQLQRSEGRPPPEFIHAFYPLSTNQTVLVTSLRLVPPAGRLDLWNPKAWSASTENRRLRRSQLEDALARTSFMSTHPEILGGDFNAPVSDAVYRLRSQWFGASFLDAHREAGRGWGNTALNSLPIARSDQIWLKGSRAISVHTVRTKHSDHRMVVADIEFPAPRQAAQKSDE